MAIIALANQKGGVAKTTTVHALAEGMAELGQSILAIDLDPQASLTYACGIDPEALPESINEVLVKRTALAEVIVDAGLFNLAPSAIDLAGAEIHLMTKTGREFALAKALRKIESDYDNILIDCGPSLGILTINGLTAAEYVLVPFQAETLSQRGVGQLLETIEDVRSYTNDNLKVLGGIATMFDGRTNLSHQVVDSVSAEHKLEILDPPIPKSVRVAEAPGFGRSVLTYAPNSKPAVAYRQLIQTILGRL